MKISHKDNKSCNKPKDLKEQIAWETKRKEKELYTWRTLIQPIIDGYDIKGIEYEFVSFWDEYGRVINKETTPLDIYEMECFIIDLCNGRPFNSFEGLLRKWQNSTAGDTFSYKDFFIDFMTHLFEKDTLPHFLEFLAKNVPATTKQKEADPFWPYVIPPKPIERKSAEKALWDKHIDPIVKTHNLRNMDGEFFQYRLIDKEMDKHGVLMIMRKTMLMKDIIKTTLAQHGIPENEFEQIDPYDASYSFTELLKWLKDTENGNTIKPVVIKIGEEITKIDIDFREVFHSFLKDVFRNETLPEFLEMLRLDGPTAETDPELISTEDEESRLQDDVARFEKKDLNKVSGNKSPTLEEKDNPSDVLHPPPGTKWEDVKITLTASDKVRIETPHGKGQYTYHMLGMADGRRPDESKEVWTTLSLFAVNHGVVPQKGAKTYINNITEKTKKLNKHLKGLFKINDSIFKHHFRKYHRYETKIVFSNQMEMTVPRNEHAESAFELGTEDTKNFTNESTPWD